MFIKLNIFLLLLLIQYKVNCVDDIAADEFGSENTDDEDDNLDNSSGLDVNAEEQPSPQNDLKVNPIINNNKNSQKSSSLPNNLKETTIAVAHNEDDTKFELNPDDDSAQVDENENNLNEDTLDGGSNEDLDENEIIDDDNEVENDDNSNSNEQLNTPSVKPVTNNVPQPQPEAKNPYSRARILSMISKPGILAGIIGGIVIGLLTAILLIMFIVYRMRKKDEGSYALEDTKKPLSSYEYRNVPTKEFYA